MLDAIAKPFGWLLMRLYEIFGNYGIAIIMFALIVRLLLLPFMARSKRSSLKTTRLQPKMAELQKKHGANQMKYNEEIQKLYRQEKINPMSGCLWSLVPFPILIALYQAIRFPLTIMMGVPKALLETGGAILEKLNAMNFTTDISNAYLQIAQSQFISDHFSDFAGFSDKLVQIDYSFLGMNLGAQPKWNALFIVDWSDVTLWTQEVGLFMIPILAALLTFVSSWVSMKLNPITGPQAGSMKMMLYMMPLVTLWMAFIMPASLGLYWIVGTVFAIFQDIILTKKYKKQLDAEDEEKRRIEKIREMELEEKRKETERLRAMNATVQNPNTSKKKQQKQQRQEHVEKASEWEKKGKPQKAEEGEPSRVGKRMYARGRAYDPNRYADNAGKETAAKPEEPEEETGVPALEENTGVSEPVEEAPAQAEEAQAEEPADEAGENSADEEELAEESAEEPEETEEAEEKEEKK